MKNSEDEVRSEYSLGELGKPVRGKHHESYKEGSNVVVIESDLVPLFPNSDAVNEALRQYAASIKKSAP